MTYWASIGYASIAVIVGAVLLGLTFWALTKYVAVRWILSLIAFVVAVLAYAHIFREIANR